jgi:hypothetical protein
LLKHKYGYILKEGAIKGKSPYIIATEDEVNSSKDLLKVRWAIYNYETDERVSDFFDWISPNGIVNGESEFFRATKNKKEALFTFEKQVSPWYRKIRDRGALTGESNYYWAKEKAHYSLYNIKTGEKLTPDFKSSVLFGAVIGDTDNLVVGSFGEEIFFIYDIKNQKIVSKEFDEDALIEILKLNSILEALEKIGA